MMTVRLFPLLLLLGAGCATDHSARFIELEAAIARLETRIDRLAGQGKRIDALEAVLARPARDPLLDRLALQEARLLALEKRLRGLESGKPGTTHRARDGVVTVRMPKDQRTPPPRAGSPIQVLTVGSGRLLLIRHRKRLFRVELAGVEIPRRGEEYAGDAALKTRHAKRFRRLSGDAAWKASRRHLEQLLKAGGEVRLAYPEGGRRRKGSLKAYLELKRAGRTRDLNAAMIEDGYALASADPHARSTVYQRLGKQARGAARGLLRKSE